MGLLDDTRNFMQGASNSVTGMVSAPVDGIAWAMRKAGLGNVIGNAPVGGSDWMQAQGLLRAAPGKAGLLGEALGGVVPMIAAAKAPQIAAGMLKAGQNLAVPSTIPMLSQRGAIITKTEEYAGSHRPPMSDNGGAPAHDLTGAGLVYPDDVYSSMAARYYGHGENTAEDAALFQKLHALRGKPDAPVIVYRAVPSEVMKNSGNRINHGDWVTPSRSYAVDHGERTLNGDYKLQRIQVPAKAIYTNGDSPYEFGLDRIAGGLDP